MSEWDVEPENEVPPGTWAIAKYGGVLFWDYHLPDVRISIEPRPHYCDRGKWLAHVLVRHGLEHPHRLTVDFADLWPRMYFDLDRAKLECEAWLRARGQLA